MTAGALRHSTHLKSHIATAHAMQMESSRMSKWPTVYNIAAGARQAESGNYPTKINGKS
jgi:hypothetical protein